MSLHQTIKNIEPISIGFDGPEIRIQYPADFWNALGMGGGRIYSHFRQSVQSPDLIFEADTATGSILIEPDQKLMVKLPASATAKLKAGVVVFDFVHVLAGKTTPIPGSFTWPVISRVTRNG